MATETQHDPVCHMDITISSAAGRSEHGGITYYFCSMGCKRDFDNDPEGALKREAEYDHSRGVDHMAMGMSDTAATGRPWWQFWRRS